MLQKNHVCMFSENTMAVWSWKLTVVVCSEPADRDDSLGPVGKNALSGMHLFLYISLTLRSLQGTTNTFTFMRQFPRISRMHLSEENIVQTCSISKSNAT